MYIFIFSISPIQTQSYVLSNIGEIVAWHVLLLQVIKIKVQTRIGKEDFVTSVRNVLAAHYKDQPVGK
jgi:Domain of Unknown Function (DUF1907).